MITLTKTDGSQITLNSELIKWLDGTADHTTTITLVTENRLMVRENVEEIIQSVVNYKRLINIYELDPDVGNLDPSIKNR
ncbi:flagellar protein FlbD [Candidatus Poribacteria bacterium]|jgi:flagellar protein FlbD|nr:flagellar protein FlbD [Candidatus Poribacteria bacterium]MDP6597282.1 flagellar FlbD family protein [Candidatus Poribacteria bacterium]MDP6750975.1 flagellar FlbD family protein [Candidatus Poribacteria bacterium]